ncbi:hypothetical protein ACVCAH_27940 [Micromonospora sp. LZ34]
MNDDLHRFPVGLAPSPAPPPPAPPAERRRWLWIAAGAGIVLLVVAAVAVVATAAVVWRVRAAGLSKETAQRECRTAIEREAHRRVSNSDSDRLIIIVKGVDLQETWETDNGWGVNGTMRYTMMAPLMPTVENSVSLTCEAAEKDGRVSTTVKNRI